MNSSKQKQLNDLIVAKFGEGHGSKAAAFRVTGMKHIPYFYAMTSGNAAVPDKVLKTLAALPDYEPDPLYIAPIDPVISAQYGDYVLHINKDDAELLIWFLKRIGQKPPITSKHVSVIFPDALRAYIETFAEHKFALKDYDVRVAKAAKSPAEALEPDAFD